MASTGHQNAKQKDGVSTRRRVIGSSILVAMVMTLLGVGTPTRQVDARPDPQPGVKLEQAWPGTLFQRPICVTNDGASVFVCQQGGLILRLDKYIGSGPVPKLTVYLDLTQRVDASGQGGVLGMAFHPQFASNGRFFVSYLAKGTDTKDAKFEFRVCEYSGSRLVGDPNSEQKLVSVFKKRNTHQAGGIEFGPDGMLYVAIGDGMEKQPKRQWVSQEATSKLGKILRYDVSTPGKPKPPADNPWVEHGGPYVWIWSYGYRNPWRFDWDAKGRMWTAEPGTKGPTSCEWIVEVKKGGNARWPKYEGDRRRPEISNPLAPPELPPAFVYGGADTGGDNAVVGGKFYRGKRVPALAGRYIFCDYMQKEVYALDLSSGRGRRWTVIGSCKGPADVGRDADGELYVCDIDAGIVYTIHAR